MDYRIEQLRYQLREDPSSRVFYKLGEQLRRRGEPGDAAAVLRQGLELHPRYVAAWVSLGRSLRDANDNDGAAAAFSRAFALDQTHPVAARALGELAIDREDWAEAARNLDVVRADAVNDSQLHVLISRVDVALEQEAARLHAASAKAIPADRPPAEVVSLSDDDPFAGEGLVEDDDEGEQEPQDVFGVASDQDGEWSEEPVHEAPAPQPSSAVFDDVDEDPGVPEVDAPAVSADDPFEGMSSEPDFPPAEPTEIESWSDVVPAQTGDDGVGVSGQVEPPPEDETTETPGGEAIEDAPTDDRDIEQHQPVPEIAEPDLDWVSDTVEETEVESWADVATEAVDPDVENEERLESLESIIGMGSTDATEPIIPETLAHFDHPVSVEIEEEPVPVAPKDVPLPTVTLARLAVEQGDTGLAEATLTGLLERDPGNVEARDLLGELRNVTATDHGDSMTAKVAALRGWLDTIRLASERHSS